MAGELVSYDWCRTTGGALTAAQRRTLRVRSLRQFAGHGVGLARLAAGRRPAPGSVVLPVAPDAKLVTSALEAAADQGPDVEGHGLRTWLFGGALAAVDGVAYDPELLCVAGICHDAGTAQAVAGQDFTVRSAHVAVEAFAQAGRALDPADEARLRDGIVAHATAGVTTQDTVLGTYVQAGALLDLAGMRLADLPADIVDEAFRRHPVGDVRRAIIRVIDEEARAVPRGRFAQSRRLGLTAAIRLSPSLKGRD